MLRLSLAWLTSKTTWPWLWSACATLGNVRGKLRAADAVSLAGFDRRSWYRSQLVGRAMRDLGWERGRYRFGGGLHYAYAKGSRLERELVLDVERAADGVVLKWREP